MYFTLMQRPGKGAPSVEAYHFQRKVAHDLHLPVTICMPADDMLTEPELVKELIDDRDNYGADIALYLGSDIYQAPFPWLATEENKRKGVKHDIEVYRKTFGRNPTSVFSYGLDATLAAALKEEAPEVKISIASCFEEGAKTFHGCNNTWHLYAEGACWSPWYPSKGNTARPAESKEDWAGFVAVPHLCRDLVLAYENRDDFYASHPANVQRGLANDGCVHDYDFNLVDQWRMTEDYNFGYSYYQIHVGAAWLIAGGVNINVSDPQEVSRTLYRETLEYMKELVDKGEVEAMTLSQFGERFCKEVPIAQQQTALANDILMGSGKQYFWACDAGYRVLLDLFQGGSIGDLRPYAGKYDAVAGPDAEDGNRMMYLTYPYLIQSQYRGGSRTHFSDGTRTTLFVTHGGETLDMCDYNTKKESFSRTVTDSTLTLKPVDLVFNDGFRVKMQTVYHFCPKGKIEITRRVLETSNPAETFTVEEYVNASLGFIEYPENMKETVLCIDGKKVGQYDYIRQKHEKDGAHKVGVVIPSITTVFDLCTDRTDAHATLESGNLFQHNYILRLTYQTKGEGDIVSYLQMDTTK